MIINLKKQNFTYKKVLLLNDKDKDCEFIYLRNISRFSRDVSFNIKKKYPFVRHGRVISEYCRNICTPVILSHMLLPRASLY